MASRVRQLAGLVGWIALSCSAALTSVFVSTAGWYAALAKPSWNPPGWVFGPIWSTLYVLMGVAAWRVWRHGGWPGQRRPLGWFLVQWALNALWTPLFFGLHLIGPALVEIVLLWGAILATIRAFSHVDRVAAGLLIPYLAWVSFAAALTFTLWRLNP